MKKNNEISLFLFSTLIFGMMLIPSGNAYAFGPGDFFLTKEELPSGWMYYQAPYTPGPHMAVREKFVGGLWSAKRYQISDGSSVGVIVGYYPTVEEAKKVM